MGRAATLQEVAHAIERTGASGTAAEVLATVTAASIEKTDSTRKHYSDVSTMLNRLNLNGDTIVDAIREDLQTNGPKWICDQLGGVGIDFSHAQLQAKLGEMRSQNRIAPELVALLQSMGRWHESPLEYYAGERGVTTDADMVQRAMDYQSALAKWRPFVADVENGLATGAIETWEDIVALAEARAS